MKITVLCVGKIKESYYRDAIAEFQKRLSRYCSLQLIEVMDEKTPDHAPQAVMEQIKQKEGNRLRKHLKEHSYLCALDIQGRFMDSVELSQHLHQLGINGISDVTFLIGGSLGLEQKILDACDFRLSFSRMTFPHQLMRILLLEQVYRSFRLIHNEPYHK